MTDIEQEEPDAECLASDGPPTKKYQQANTDNIEYHVSSERGFMAAMGWYWGNTYSTCQRRKLVRHHLSFTGMRREIWTRIAEYFNASKTYLSIDNAALGRVCNLVIVLRCTCEPHQCTRWQRNQAWQDALEYESEFFNYNTYVCMD